MTRILDTEEVERITGVRFGDRSLLTDACSRESQRFRVFEFYGDSILNLGTILWALHSMRSENTAKRLAANRALAQRIQELFPVARGREIGDFVETLTAAVAMDTDHMKAMDFTTGLLGLGPVTHFFSQPQPPENVVRFPRGGAASLGRELVRFVVTDQLVRAQNLPGADAPELNRQRTAILANRRMNARVAAYSSSAAGGRRQRRQFYERVTLELRSGGFEGASKFIQHVVMSSKSRGLHNEN